MGRPEAIRDWGPDWSVSGKLLALAGRVQCAIRTACAITQEPILCVWRVAALASVGSSAFAFAAAATSDCFELVLMMMMISGTKPSGHKEAPLSYY